MRRAKTSQNEAKETKSTQNEPKHAKTRDGSRAATTSKMERFVIIVGSF